MASNDNFDFDDFDDFDFDLDSEGYGVNGGEDSRPIPKAVDNFTESFVDGVKESVFSQNAQERFIDELLPDEYGNLYKGTDRTLGTISRSVREVTFC